NNEWQFVGGQTVSQAPVTAISLAFDNNDIPYLSYMEYGVSGVVVKKFENDSWISVGGIVSSGLIVAHSEIAIDNNNNLYIAYAGTTSIFEEISDITIKKFDNNSWENIGETGFVT